MTWWPWLTELITNNYLYQLVNYSELKVFILLELF